MGRTIFILAILIGVTIYVRQQYQGVMRKVTTKSAPGLPLSSQSQESRRKCVLCGGTGRAASFRFGPANSSRTDICQTCHGTGWIDNPLFGH